MDYIVQSRLVCFSPHILHYIQHNLFKQNVKWMIWFLSVCACVCVSVMFSICDPFFVLYVQIIYVNVCFFATAVHAMFIFDNHIKSQTMARNTIFSCIANIHTPPKHSVCLYTMCCTTFLLLLLPLMLQLIKMWCN